MSADKHTPNAWDTTCTSSSPVDCCTVHKAAPEMLEALKRMVADWEADASRRGSYDRATISGCYALDACAVIRKAEGS